MKQIKQTKQPQMHSTPEQERLSVIEAVIPGLMTKEDGMRLDGRLGKVETNLAHVDSNLENVESRLLVEMRNMREEMRAAVREMRAEMHEMRKDIETIRGEVRELCGKVTAMFFMSATYFAGVVALVIYFR